MRLAWQSAPLDYAVYPYIVTDVIYIKVRENNRVVSKSCHIAVGIIDDGYRQIIGFLIQDGESLDSWNTFFAYLKNRGLTATQLVISDAHKGLVSAIKQSFVEDSWQRCQVHFMRNIFSSVPKKESKSFRNEVKSLFRVTDIDLALELKSRILDTYGEEKDYIKACNILDEGFEDAFQYVAMKTVSNKLKTSNVLERLNEEISRREKVIRISLTKRLPLD